MTTHLFIPDPHAYPGENNKRFDYLGKLCMDVKPDVVICAGDLFDMPSLASYDSAARKAWEHRSYAKDIEAGVEAQDRIWAPYTKAKRRRPRRVFTVGNHETPRIHRFVEAEPMLEGVVSESDMELSRYWDDVVPFLEPILIDGIAYSHYFVSGVMGRPINGLHSAFAIVKAKHMSCVAGHSHLLSTHVETKVDGSIIRGLVGGCFVDYKSHWNNSQSEAMWWSGVHILRNVDNGNYDLQEVSMRTLVEAYGT